MDIVATVSFGSLSLAIVKDKSNIHFIYIEYGQHRVEIPLKRSRELLDGLNFILREYK